MKSKVTGNCLLICLLFFVGKSVLGAPNRTTDKEGNLFKEPSEEANLLVDQLLNFVSSGATTDLSNCSMLDSAIVKEIKEYQPIVDKIIEYVMKGDHKGLTYDSLQNFTDTFGPRIVGSDALETSIDEVVAFAKRGGFDKVHTEDVTVPHWVRNTESLTMLEPRVQKMNMLGLGTSVATPLEGITAEVIVFESFDELNASSDVAGKLVLFNQPFESYSQSAQYRVHGAVRAAKKGALAVLVRSAASFSIGSPHTGIQHYATNVTEIPAASITVEDAQLIGRLAKQGITVKVFLSMGAENLPDAKSRNIVIDHLGQQRPEEYVVIAGHVDSWDVGQGVMDDAGGCFVSYNANLVLKSLGLRPRRTVRNIWYTGEEFGVYGGNDYFMKHRNESDKYQLFLESDLGTFNPKGIGFTGTHMATCVIKEILNLTASINTTEFIVSNDGEDVQMWSSLGVPTGALYSDTSKYFWFHHTAGDSLEVYNPTTLDRVTALWASVAYIVADISVQLSVV